MNHFIWLGACALCITAGLILAVKLGLKQINACRIMTVICLVSEITKIMSSMEASDEGGMILGPKALPFHLCSLMIFAVFFLTLSKNERARSLVIRFLVPVGLLGGIAAMLIPTNGVDFLDIDAYQCFVYHAGLVWFALYFVCTKQVTLTVRDYARNVCVLVALMFLMIWVNGALAAYGTNFMYVREPPMEDLPVLNLDHGWYVYLLSLMGLGAVLMTAVHVPFILAGRHKK
ncbi:MAG: YwaF family protein [Clostridia bacterium]|nr:YwaF family protein [Clostridia bacterium]